MANYSITRKYFADMLSCAVTMKNSTKTNGGVLFYNSHLGLPTVWAKVMYFKIVDNQNITVEEMKEKIMGRFDFIGAFKWIC